MPNPALFGSDETLRTAEISDCGRYRYSLHRRWDVTKPNAVWIMLNPSTADAEQDDPTIIRCMNFARSWGLGGIVVVNLYGLRATNPKELWRADDPIGPDNDRHLYVYTKSHIFERIIVAAWGANAKPDRVRQVMSMPQMQRAQCLGVTKHGAPRHPLYVRGDTTPHSFEVTP